MKNKMLVYPRTMFDWQMIPFVGLAVTIISVLLLSALAAVCLSPKRQSNILLALPKNDSIVGCTVDNIEKINKGDFVLTYENMQDVVVSALYFNGRANLIGTNYSYPFVVGASMLDGGFFTKEQSGGSVTLNVKASFDLFGDIHTVGNTVVLLSKTYLVSGVIDDGDTVNRNIYISFKNVGQYVMSFAVNFEGTTLENVLNHFKQEWITSSDYTFINVELMKEITRGKLFVAIKAAVCIMLLGVLLKYKNRFKILIQWVLTSAWIAFTIAITQSFLETCLYWFNMPKRSEIMSDSFSDIINDLFVLWTCTDFLFWGFLAFVVVAVMLWLSKKSHFYMPSSLAFITASVDVDTSNFS